jgi:putative ABC transport system permease protein
VSTLQQDLRFAVRTLTKSPGFTAIAIATLALGIGANAAVFSAVHALLLKPLPFPEPGRLVSGLAMREGFDPFGTSLLEYEAYRDGSASLSESGLGAQRDFTLLERTGPERLTGAAVMADYLDVLGVQPLLGRRFSADEDKPGGPSVALLSYELWQSHFGGDSGCVGRLINLEGRNHTIVGVLPRSFDMPFRAKVWVPLQVVPAAMPLRDRTTHSYDMVARLKPGIGLAQADAELRGIARRLEGQYPDIRRGWSYRLFPLRQQLLGDLEGRTRRSLVALDLAVGFLLLVCCANIASLLLVRGLARDGEMAIRISLGAGRARLLRQLLTESLVLALAGGAAGLLLAFWTLPLMKRLNPVDPGSLGLLLTDYRIDGPTLAFSLAATLATGVLFGLLPAARSLRRTDLSTSIRQREQKSGAAHGGKRVLSLLVVGEIAVAAALLACGGLMVKSFWSLQRVDLGFQTEKRLTMRLPLSARSYPSRAAKVAFAERLLPRIAALPGVAAAGVSTNLPLDELSLDSVFEVEGHPRTNPADVPITAHRLVSPGYLEALGVTLVRGRLIADTDRPDSVPVAVVSEELVRQAWPGEDPIGKRVRRILPGRAISPWLTVVGVVRDVKEDRFNFRITRPVWYLPDAQQDDPLPADLPMSVVVKTTGDPAALAAAVRTTIHGLDPAVPVSEVATMAEHLADLLATERFGAVLMGVLAALGLALAAIGLYGTLTLLVRQRTGEIGLRMALGARPGDILRLVLGRGAALSAAGLAAGLLGGRALAQVLAGSFYGVGPSDPATFATVGFILASCGLAACFFPARRASRVDPMTALRGE